MSAGMNSCISSLRFDRWLAGDLDEDAARTLQAHVAGCESCAWRKREIKAFRDRFEATRPPRVRPTERDALTAHRGSERPPLTVIPGGRTDQPTAESTAEPPAPDAAPVTQPAPQAGAIVRPAQRRTRRMFPAAIATALAAAAALLVVLRPGTDPTLDERTGTSGSVRRKGAGSIDVFIQHQGKMRAGHSGEVVYPGDALQLAYSTTDRTHLAVLGRDQAGVASIYFADGERAAAIEPGEQVPLPSSIILDDTLGTEMLYALLCAEPVAVEPVREALEQPGATPAVPGCEVEELRLEKRAP
jgi:hypothetical protein